MNMMPHFILELANSHGGDVKAVTECIEQFSKLQYDNLAIKFQVFKFDSIALPEYAYYDTYKKLFISKEKWERLIELAKNKFGKVWLDLFCSYGLEVLEENRESVYGVKLQASVLGNLEVFNRLQKIDMSNKKLMINISGYELTEIEEFVSKFNNLGFGEVILQMGFQGYPTKIEDSSLRKIDVLKSYFPGLELSYADHVSAEDEFSRDFPVYAYLRGCNYLEKHICLKRTAAKYDYFSALEFGEVEKVLDAIKKVNRCHRSLFINDSEREYLESSMQKCVLAGTLYPGQLVSDSDLLYRRTNKSGINVKELHSWQNKFQILDRQLGEHDTVTIGDFRKSRIGVIVAGRMKSTRLKNKAVLPIHGVPSVEVCLESCLKIPYADKVILATSSLKEDEMLGKHLLNGKVKFWQGDPEDVIGRYIGACEHYGVDVIVRVTADCPVVSPEIVRILLESHFEQGADYTSIRRFSVGTNSQVYNLEALKRVISYVGRAECSEYMTWYMENNSDIFKVNMVDLPDDMVRDYRLTLDYQEDLDMFNLLFKKLEEEDYETNLANIFDILDKNPSIANINSHLSLKYVVDQELIRKLNKVTRIRK